MRGENCVDARVRVISRIANTIDTTVMIEVAMLLRITCATPGSSCEGKRVLGIQALIAGRDSSSDESTAPAAPRIMAMASGRMRKPPRSAYGLNSNIAPLPKSAAITGLHAPQQTAPLRRLSRDQLITTDWSKSVW
jgi:hypothetical protein